MVARVNHGRLPPGNLVHLFHLFKRFSVVIAEMIIYGVPCKQFFFFTTRLFILDQYTMNALIIKDSGYLDVLFTPTVFTYSTKLCAIEVIADLCLHHLH